MEFLILISFLGLSGYAAYLILFGNPIKSQKTPITDDVEINLDVYSKSDKQEIADQVKRLLDIIHESIDIAKKSTVPDTKISRLRVANDRFKFLLGYIDKYDFIEITN